MADFGNGSLATGRLETWENWNNSYQVSYHFKLSLEIRGGAFNTNGPTAGPYYNLQHVGDGYFTYNSNGWRTLREGDATFNKDANGYVTVNSYGYIDGKNSPYVVAASTTFNSSPARIGVAPAMNNPTASSISVATATISGTAANNGLGTSTTVYLRYKRTADSDATYQQLQTTSWALTGLRPGTSHTIQIYGANNNGDTAGWVNTQTFTTLPAPANSTAMLRVLGIV